MMYRMGPLEMRLDGGENLVGHRSQSGIHHQHAVFAGLHGDVTARADNHVDVALHRPDVDFSILILRAGQAARLATSRCRVQSLHFASAFVAGAAPRILS